VNRYRTTSLLLLVSITAAAARAQSTQPAASDATAASRPADVSDPAVGGESPKPTTQPAKRTAPASKAYGARLENPPYLRYVKPLSALGLPGTEEFDWLDFGLQHRTRWNYRVDDYQRDPATGDDNQFLLRSLGYVGIREILDPIRFGFEFQDSRQFNSILAPNNQDTDEADIVQAYVELYFPDVFGKDDPFKFQVGRFTMDYADRKLIARNGWRNTTAFDGFRVQLGDWASDWQLDVFAVQPVERFLHKFNHGDEERWFFGIEGAWRKWKEYVVLEPYYLILAEQRDDPDVNDREIHTIGFHAFGPILNTRFDYDVAFNYQFGHDGDRRHRAFATHGEIGYTFDHPWKPRVSFYNQYATGDRDPDDNLNERFDRLFNAAHPFSTSDFFNWQNVIVNKLRLDAQPSSKLRFDVAYGTYWLASDSDSWIVARRRDPRGRSGDFVGQELEMLVRYRIDPRIEIEMGYSHFMPGAFVRNTGTSEDSDFFYVQTTFSLFK
jgi:hypothetical protein